MTSGGGPRKHHASPGHKLRMGRPARERRRALEVPAYPIGLWACSCGLWHESDEVCPEGGWIV
jgi:hypothetical protein